MPSCIDPACKEYHPSFEAWVAPRKNDQSYVFFFSLWIGFEPLSKSLRGSEYLSGRQRMNPNLCEHWATPRTKPILKKLLWTSEESQRLPPIYSAGKECHQALWALSCPRTGPILGIGFVPLVQSLRGLTPYLSCTHRMSPKLFWSIGPAHRTPPI